MHLRQEIRIFGWAMIALLLLPPTSATAQRREEQSYTRHIEVGMGADEWYRGRFRGDVAAEELAPGCVGYVPSEPHFVLELDSERWVRVTVEPEDENVDTVLLMRGRSGPICNDNASRHTLNPEIMTHLEPGRYRVFVGTTEAGAEGRFNLHIIDAAESELPELTSGESLRLLGRSGGNFDAAEFGDDCIGAVASTPNHVVLVADSQYWAITAVSSSDLTLVVVTQDGVRCNDDGPQTLDPQIVDWFHEGPISVYVGSHNPDVQAYYSLEITPGQPGSYF